jgi:hypothetical protein
LTGGTGARAPSTARLRGTTHQPAIGPRHGPADTRPRAGGPCQTHRIHLVAAGANRLADGNPVRCEKQRKPQQTAPDRVHVFLVLPVFPKAPGYVAPGTVALQWRHTDADVSISPEQDGQALVCDKARLDRSAAVLGVAGLMGQTDQTSAAIQPRIVQPSSQLSATIGFQSG